MRRIFWLAALLAPLAGAQPEQARLFVTKNCVLCHNHKSATAGVALDTVDFTNVGPSSATLEKVLRKVRTGEMPPPAMPRPDAMKAKAFTGWLEGALDKNAAEHPNPGRTVIHRLNRAEYSNAIRDLLALNIRPGELLPVDDSGYGFDNIGDVLSLSPALLDRYIAAARLVSRLAVGDPAAKPEEDEYTPPDYRARTRRNERVSEDLPFDSSGGMAIHYYFPLDADYLIRVKVPMPAIGDAPSIPAVYEVKVPVKAGLRVVGVTYLRESAVPEIEAPPPGRRVFVPPAPPSSVKAPPAELDIRLDGVCLKRFEVPRKGPGTGSSTPPSISSVLIGGPYNPTGSGETPSREHIFTCHPANAAEQAGCAAKILGTLTRRAFRRPVTDADIRPLMTFYRQGLAEGGFDHGIEAAIRAMLVSPDFLFRVERDPKGSKPGSVVRVSDIDLASRLSFFLWSSIPDDELLGLAEHGRLHDPQVLSAQVRRMLADSRSQALVNNFAGQWLYLRNLAVARPDPDVFPDFDESLRRAFLEETDLFFQSVLREDRSVLDLLDANYTFLNERLAEHYGIPDVYGSQFRRVALTDPNRGGLLGQGSILTVTSYPDRTSVVQRGKWILENLLGTPPPPPPAAVPNLEPHGKDGRLLTMREQMEQHRSNAICASCHARMDPLGFALENYDGVGKWRVKDSGNVIDATGKLPDGTVFDGPAGLKKALLTAHRDEYISTLTEKLLLYALGRGLEYYDMPAVRTIASESAKDDYRISSLISAIIESTPFQMRRTREQ